MNTPRRRAYLAILAGLCAFTMSAQSSAEGSFTKTGPVNAITDVNGILVGCTPHGSAVSNRNDRRLGAGTTAMTGATGGAYVPAVGRAV